MEKFAVDLDKVLDELEFDEDQAENAISGGKFMVPSNNQVVNPLYHMPTFDPMTGSSCVTAPPPCTSSLSTNGQYRLGSGGTFSWRHDSASQKKSVSGVFSSLNDYISSSENVPASIIAPQDDDDDEDDEPWVPPTRPITTDDKKPDVVGSSTADFGDNVEISLPDVAAGAPAPASDDITSAFDLINHQNNSADSVACDISTSEPLATISTSSDEPTDPEKNTNMIRFGLTEDLSDSELHLYLEELEAEEEEARMNAGFGQSAQVEAGQWGRQVDNQVEPISSSGDTENKRSLLEELVSSDPQQELVSSETKEMLSSGNQEEVVSSTRKEESFGIEEQIDLSARNEEVVRGEEIVSSASEEEVVPSVKEGEVVSSVKEEEVVSSVKEEEVVSSVKEEEVVSSVREEEVVPSVREEEVVSSVREEEVVSSVREEEVVSSVREEEVVSSVREEDVVSSVREEEVVSSMREEEVVSSVKEEVVSSVKEEVVSSVKEEVVSSAREEEVVSSVRDEHVSSVRDEDVKEEVVLSVTNEPAFSPSQEVVSPEPQEELVSSATICETNSGTLCEPETSTSDLVLEKTKPSDETEINAKVLNEVSDTSSLIEPLQSSQVEPLLESHKDREEISRSTKEELVPVEAVADSTEEPPLEHVVEEPVSSKKCEADSTGSPEQRFEEERKSGFEEEPQESSSSQPSEESIDDKPTRPSTLKLPTGPAGDGISSTEETLPYSEPGPAGATPIATRPPPSESSGPGESPLQSPDQSEDTSSLASGCEAHSEATGSGDASETPLTPEERGLGKTAPVWILDEVAATCMLCGLRFTVIRRRHHCRACGRVVCSKCGSARAPLAFMSNNEARVCVVCHKILTKVQAAEQGEDEDRGGATGSGSTPLGRAPNPNNPMEYCSTVPPLQQAAGALQQPAPSVMVPVVGVLKREGSTKPRSEAKQVMFSDGIRPGGDLTELDGSAEPRLPIRRPGHLPKRVGTPSDPNFNRRIGGMSMNALPVIDRVTNSYIPDGDGLPPLATKDKGTITYEKNPDCGEVMALLRDEATPPLRFALNRNLYVIVKIVTLDCCVKRVCWCFTSDGLSCVGQDEVVIVLGTRNDDVTLPKDVFLHINYIYHEAATGNTVSEMGHTLAVGHSFLGSDLHAGFMYIRHTTQCVQRLILPPAPFLFGVLIHRWEVPWVRIFPIRLMLRLGAEYRYYPCPLISVRERPSVYGEIGDTVIKFLADFRDMQYTLPSVRGLVIHMEDKRITVLLPRNRYDQVLRALNQSNDHVLAFGAVFSEEADAHLVCMQKEGEESKYYTSAIEISYKTRKVTGASFIVFSGSLKVSCGMNAKSSIKEDGFVISVTSETLDAIRAALHDMKDYRITCGPIAPPDKSAGAAATTTNTGDGEEVLLKWTKDDCCFNIGVKSEVDGKPLDGVPSMRVHSGIDYPGGSRLIRWTEVFLLQMDEGSGRAGDSMDISRLSSSLSKATCMALVRLLDLLAAVGIYTLAVRATIHPDNVGYEAGSNGEHLPPIYMKSLDDALIPVLNKAAANSADGPTVLELVFKIMEN